MSSVSSINMPDVDAGHLLLGRVAQLPAPLILSALAIEGIIYLERCQRLLARQGDQNGKHNFYQRPEGEVRPQGQDHGSRDARA
jgi:hypothetical protein